MTDEIAEKAAETRLTYVGRLPDEEFNDITAGEARIIPEGIALKLDAALMPFQHHDFAIVDTRDGQQNEDYYPLSMVLCAAYAQAEGGKGKERHALGDPFLEQPILTIGRLFKSADGEAYQAVKKLREGLQMAKRGDHDAAMREFLGAINYVAAVAILIAEDQHEKDIREFAEMQRNQPAVTPVDENEGLDPTENVTLKMRMDTTEWKEKLSEVQLELDDAAQKMGRAKFLLEHSQFKMISKDRSRFTEVRGAERAEALLSAGWEFFDPKTGYNLQHSEKVVAPEVEPETITHRHINEDGAMREVEVPIALPQAGEPVEFLHWRDVPVPQPGERPTKDQYYAALRRDGRSHADADEISDIAAEWDHVTKYGKGGHLFRAVDAMGKWRRSEAKVQG